jgi:Protein of unknown function (DUF1706)
MSTDYPTSITELEARIEAHRLKLIVLIDSLSAPERDEIRDPAGWSTKDHVVHLSMWERSMDYLLNERPRHEGLGVDLEVYLGHDYDVTNDAIFRQHRERDWESVRAEFDEVHADLLQTLRAVGWDDLQLTYSHYAPDEPGEDSGQPVVVYVAGNTFYHYDEHRAWIEELLASGQSEGSSPQ